MKTQMYFLIAIACMNITIFMVMNARGENNEYLFPGVNYTRPLNASGTVSNYEERFNASDVVEKWQSTPFSGIPVIGDIFSGLSLFYNQYRFLIDGVPALTDWFSSFVPVNNTAFAIFSNAFRVLVAIMVATLLIEFVSGRRLID